MISKLDRKFPVWNTSQWISLHSFQSICSSFADKTFWSSSQPIYPFLCWWKHSIISWLARAGSLIWLDHFLVLLLFPLLLGLNWRMSREPNIYFFWIFFSQGWVLLSLFSDLSFCWSGFCFGLYSLTIILNYYHAYKHQLFIFTSQVPQNLVSIESQTYSYEKIAISFLFSIPSLFCY